ncbi:Uncharacterised protein [Phocoenobacter uteri]|uniref:Uncharacterized protein n=1 Tax=Phocoenobacter uteri TaxID=146806 RepID=A0A379C8M3_9PAST|nr:hypothetical protein [Phocoenobacter uteri]MDG6882413.1 hypothetical protein [Phocoenobacter uteri]SUB58571.1 Uncharacterised protein [Phocoenobacter uteri]
MKKLTGIIKFKKDDNNNDYAYVSSDGIEYSFKRKYNEEIWAKIDVGSEISFEPCPLKNGKFCAINIQLLNEPVSVSDVNQTISPSDNETEKRLVGIIKFKSKDDSKDGYAYILSNEKQYLFKRQYNQEIWSSIDIGTAVSFELYPLKNGKFCAVDIQLIDNKNVQVVQNESSTINKSEKITEPQEYSSVEKWVNAHGKFYDNWLSQLINSIYNLPQDYIDYADFEDMTFALLKLLGIHEISQFSRNDQRGKADGFFRIGNFAVMYDCTLENDFYLKKKDQIENYLNKLNQKSQLTLSIIKSDGSESNKTIQISNLKKQVWIITRGKTQELEEFEGIKVKEISIDSLLKIFSNRLNSKDYNEDRLLSDLMLIS